MKDLIKNLGIVLVLLGVVVFVIYSQSIGANNGLLIAGLSLEIVGFFAHILLNKYVK